MPKNLESGEVPDLKAMIPERHKAWIEDVLARHGVAPLPVEADAGAHHGISGEQIGWTHELCRRCPTTPHQKLNCHAPADAVPAGCGRYGLTRLINFALISWEFGPATMSGRKSNALSNLAPRPSIAIPQNMKNPDYSFTIAQPAVTVEDIDDPATVNAGIELLDQEAVKLQSQPLRARRVIVRLGAAMVVFHASNLRLRTRTSVHAGLLAYVAFGPHARGSVNGLPVRPGMLLTAAPESEARFVVDAGWENLAFLLPPEDIRAHLAIRQRDREFRMPQGVETLQVSEARARQLFDWGKRLVDTAVLDPALFNESEAERSAAQVELFEMLLATLDVANDFEPSRSDRTRQAQSLIVKAAEDYVLSQTGATLYVTDLCKAAGVSERTLEYAFKAVTGLTPVAYLIRLRLHRVRQSLLAAPPGSSTVSAEALKWGFWHFGEFSRAYRDCFGELPSDTLLRQTALLENQ